MTIPGVDARTNPHTPEEAGEYEHCHGQREKLTALNTRKTLIRQAGSGI